MSDYSQDQLDEIWENINSGKYGDDPGSIKAERVSSDEHSDTMSIPNQDGTDRAVYERKKGGTWEIIPYVGETGI